MSYVFDCSARAREAILKTLLRNLDAGRSAGRLPPIPNDTSPSPVPEPPDVPESVVRQVAPADAETLWGTFASRLEALGDVAERVDSRNELPTALERIAKTNNLRSGIVDTDALDWVGLKDDRIGGATVKKSGDKSAAFEADFGLTLCDCAVAEGGTIVLRSASQRARLTSLAPPVHIALIPFSRLVPDLFDLCGREDMVARNFAGAVWITGSSRTADIESILIRGVHGPATVIALGIADA